jgi:hypothetical protein
MVSPVAGRISAFKAAPGCVGLRLRFIFSHVESGESFGSAPCKRTCVSLYGERNGSPADSVTYHETSLQTVQKSTAVTIALRAEFCCRKNTPHVVRNWQTGLNTPSASVLETERP